MSNTAGEAEQKLRRSQRHHASSMRQDAAREEAAPARNKVKGGLVYLKQQLTEDFMKKAGIEKPEAEQLIDEKWSQMRNEEQIFWTEIQKKELGGVARRVESRPTAGVAGNTQVEIKPFSWSFDKMKYYRTGREDS